MFILLFFIIHHLSSFLSSVYCCVLCLCSSAWEANKVLYIELLQNRQYVQTPYSGPNLACNSGTMVCAYRLNFIWISVLCHPLWGKKPPKCRNFDQIFTFWGALVPISLYRSGPNFAGNCRHMVYIFMPNFIWICYCVTFQRKLQFEVNFNTWMCFCTQPPLPMSGPNLVC